MFDLTPAATEMTRLVAQVRDDQLDDPTPDDGWQVANLLEHVHEFATVFTLNARKAPVAAGRAACPTTGARRSPPSSTSSAAPGRRSRRGRAA